MATKDETNTSALPAFSVLKEHERRATVLKTEGKTNEQITAHINDEFSLTHSVRTVQEWFASGGRLEQAFVEYNEALAAASLRDARQILKRGSRAAAARLISTMNNPDARVALDAAKAVLNKYVPDRQLVSDGLLSDDDLPNELADVGDALLKGADDGSKPVDDTPEGETPGGSAGSAGGEDVPPPVLPEQPATD